jgi:PAS domain S-box-containing protein
MASGVEATVPGPLFGGVDPTSWLAAIVESSADAVISETVDGIVTSWNPAAERLYGFRAGEVVGRSTDEIVPDDRRAEIKVLRAAVEAGESVVEFETKRVRKDGVQIDVSLTLSPIRDAMGAIGGISLVARDITARKQVERALRQSAEQYKLVLQTANDAFISIDRQGRIRSWNTEAERLLGWVHEEVVDKAVAETVIPERFRQAHRDGLEHFLATGEAAMFNKRLELAALTRSGEEIPIEMTIWPVAVGDDYLFNAFLRDLRPQRDAEEERVRAHEEAIRSQRSETVALLAGGLAHDFNNVLTIVSAQTEMLALHANAETCRRVGEMQSAIARASILTQRLLAFAQRHPAQPEPLEIDDVIDQLEPMIHAALSSRVTLVRNRTADKRKVRIDRGQLEQVIVNLTLNARDAMPDGGTITFETASISVGESDRPKPYVRPGNYVALHVRDTGIGIAPDAHDRIFEPFFTTKAEGAGTGLGLASVYGIVKRSAGYVWAESSGEDGTQFTLLLPNLYPWTESGANASIDP